MKKKYMIITVVAVICVAGWMKLSHDRETKPIIVFNAPIVFMQNQHSTDDFIPPSRIEEEGMPSLFSAEDIIDHTKSSYDEVSFSQNLMGKDLITGQSMIVNTSEPGRFKGTLYARKGNIVKKFSFNYEVKAVTRLRTQPLDETTTNRDSLRSFLQ